MPEGAVAKGPEHASVDQTSTPCVLFVPAYNEASRILRCLDSMVNQQLPAGCVWREWVVFAGGSTDGTAQLVANWAAHHDRSSAPPVRVNADPMCWSKADKLATCHAELVAAGRRGETVVIIDADLAALPGAVEKLLQPLSGDPELAVVWGADFIDDRSWGRRGSAFQLEACDRPARLRGNRAPRAYGRFLAYRVQPLAEFTWQTGMVVEDTQLSAFALAHNLPVISAFDAQVLVTQPRGYEDFYLRTYRGYRALDVARGSTPRAESRISIATTNVRAFGATASSDPVGACCYAVARAIAAVKHHRRRLEFTDQYPQASSTKGPVEGRPSAHS